MNRDNRNAGSQHWSFDQSMSLAMLLLFGGVGVVELFDWLRRTPGPQTTGGPTAIVKQAGPQAEIEARPAPKPGLELVSGEEPEKNAEAKSDPKPVDWSAVGNSRVEGDLNIDLPAAIVGDLRLRAFNRPVRTKLLCVRLRVENTSKTRVIRWRGWRNQGSAQDEHGNTYRPDSPTNPYQFDANNFVDPLSYLDRPDDPHNPTGGEDKDMLEPLGWAGDDGCPIHPGKVYIAYIYFEAPPSASEEIRLTLPASVLDRRSHAQWPFRLPIEHLE
jgi:hypothetical protein